MAKTTSRRGLQNMRTQSSRKAVASLKSPELYIRLTSLEMERARRVMERDRLLERVHALNERLSVIAIEQDEMRSRIAERSAVADEQRQATPHPIVSCGFTY